LELDLVELNGTLLDLSSLAGVRGPDVKSRVLVYNLEDLLSRNLGLLDVGDVAEGTSDAVTGSVKNPDSHEHTLLLQPVVDDQVLAQPENESQECHARSLRVPEEHSCNVLVTYAFVLRPFEVVFEFLDDKLDVRLS